MSTPLRNQVESALADLRAKQEQLREFGSAMAAQKTEVTSKNRMVSATVDSYGRLVDLAIKGSRYRTLAPAELAKVIVETVAKAQEKASKQTMAAAAEAVPQAFELGGLTGGDLDLDAMFDAAVRFSEQPIFNGQFGGAESGKEMRDV
jgi:DNA-binding protein YbaB